MFYLPAYVAVLVSLCALALSRSVTRFNPTVLGGFADHQPPIDQCVSGMLISPVSPPHRRSAYADAGLSCIMLILTNFYRPRSSPCFID